MKILLRTPVDQFSGYGNDGIGLARALLDRGHDVRLSPSGVNVPLPRDIAMLLTLPVDDKFDVAIHHLEPEKVNLSVSEAALARKNVFWSMWEWQSMASQPWADSFDDRTKFFDRIVAYDFQSAEAFSGTLLSREPDRILSVQGGFSSSLWKPFDGSSSDHLRHANYTFAMNGRLSVRKGVYTAYRAFTMLQEKYGEDFQANLVLQSTAPVFPAEFNPAANVYLPVRRMLPDELQKFYWSIDCLLCPSWGEGKNLPALEALASGVPVVLSDIPAHRQWASSNEVTWAPTEEKNLQPGLRGGYVRPEALAEIMWDQYTQRAAERSKAATAALMVRQAMDWSKCVERLSLTCDLLL